jgi:Rrf2 family transcriptional regulator, iron-sulfur cluster assembly transcription factor
MKLSTQIRYGVRALCAIASSSEGNPMQVKVISEKEGLPARYIEQIFQKFKKAGIIKSARGPFGGYYLARKPEEVRVGDVIRAVDGKEIQLVFCTGVKKGSQEICERYGLCVSRDVWEEASRRLMDYFDSVTIDHLCMETKKRMTEQGLG